MATPAVTTLFILASALHAQAIEVETSVVTRDGTLARNPSVPFVLSGSNGFSETGFTNPAGQTPSIAAEPGTTVAILLGEAPSRGGMVLGHASNFDVAAPASPADFYSHIHVANQGWAETVEFDSDNDAGDAVADLVHRRYCSIGYSHWRLRVGSALGLSTVFDVGMLLGDDQIDETLAYYDSNHSLPDHDYDRGLALHLRSEVDFAHPDDYNTRFAVLMKDYNPSLRYRDLSLKLVFFADSSADPGSVTLQVQRRPGIDVEPDTYFFTGALPVSGLLCMLWTDNSANDETSPTVLLSPQHSFSNSANPSPAPTGCTDCFPDTPEDATGTPCTPPGLNSFVQWLFADDCPNEGAFIQTKCDQSYTLLSMTCHDAPYNGVLEEKLSWVSEGEVSCTVPINDVEISGSFSFDSSGEYPVEFLVGDHGCGQCIRIWRRTTMCVSTFENHEPLYRFVEGVHRNSPEIELVEPCGRREDPDTTSCHTESITSTSCDRTPQ